jgi:twitching motility protein PilI
MAKHISNTEAQTHDAQAAHGIQPAQPAARWLACVSPQNRYLFVLDHTGEIIRGATVTKVPFTQPWFCGLISLRGKLHGVIDLPDFLVISRGAISEESTGLRRQMDEQSGCILTLGPSLGMLCGLVVGKLEGLRSAGDFDPVPASAAHCGPLINGIYRDRNGSQWLEVNLADLVTSLKRHSISLAQASL